MRMTLCVLFVLFLSYWFYYDKPVNHIPPLSENNTKIHFIDEINSKNAKIRSFSANIKGTAFPVRLHGYVKYEKDRKFNLELSSFLGRELKIGSNEDNFWFWSRSMKKLHWAIHADYHKTRMKASFNPAWFPRCLGIDKIEYKDAVVNRHGDTWHVVLNSKDGSGRPIKSVIMVDSSNIIGCAIYDSDDVLEASADIKYANGLPSKIVFTWHQHGSSMTWELVDVEINSRIDPKEWNMPDISPKIDMSRE